MSRAKGTLRRPAGCVAAAVLLGLLITGAGRGIESKSHSEALAAEWSYGDYAAVLSAYVDDSGLVDYRGLKADRTRLDAFVTAMGELDPDVHAGWSREARIAFWINAYNALTLKVIIDNYPIQSSFARSLVYPGNSIRQIPGVWKRITFTVLGSEMTLDHVEHGILRKEYSEARIHSALVCAAKGCPPLRKEPFEGSTLSAQLDDQSVRFLSEESRFRIDRDAKVVYVSPIFDWFGKDFVGTYGGANDFEKYPATHGAILGFAAGYISDEDAAFLKSTKVRLKFLDYDWELNEQVKE